MMSCKEVARAIASDEYAEAGWLRRLGIRFHLFMCRGCHHYEDQVKCLGEVARDMACEGGEDCAALERLEKCLHAEINRCTSDQSDSSKASELGAATG